MKTRREFITSITAASVAGISLANAQSADTPKTIKSRPFAKSGKSVTEMCLGGYHVGLTSDEKHAEALIETAMEEGIRFYDTARMYQGGRSETYFGKFLTPKYRDDIFLMTKSEKKSGIEVREALETSLKLLKTDHLDLWLVHAIKSPQDVEQRFNNGVIDEFLKAKDEGIVKHIGFSGHTNFKAHLKMLELLDKQGVEMESCLMPMNLVDPHYDSYILNVLPELEKRNYAVLAMKTLVCGRMLGAGPERLNKARGKTQSMEQDGVGVKEMHSYAYSLPICSLVTGCEKVTDIQQNSKISREFKGLSKPEQERLIGIAEKYAGRQMEHYKA